MASVVQFGRRRGVRVSSDEEASKAIQPPDLRQVTVLSKSEWLRIQDELNRVNKDTESMREAAQQREALHLQSKDVVKLWSNTIAGQRQKKLEAKKIREQIEEEKRKQTDREEAEFRDQKRKEAIEKAKSQLYYQTDRVKGLHRALLLTEVLKEREAQIDLKQRIRSASKDVDKEFMNMVKTRDDEALKRDQERALQKKLERRAVAEDLKTQIKDREFMRERQKVENKKDWEEIQHLQMLYQQEQKVEEERRVEQKRNLMHAHLEQLTNRDLVRATDKQKEEAEEEHRKLFVSAKQKMMQLRKTREKELFRETQMRSERIMTDVTAAQQMRTAGEEQRIAKAVAEQDAKRMQQRWEEEEKRAAMLKSIAAHRDLMRQEKEQRDKTVKQITWDNLQAKKEADRAFSEKQQLKAQKIREDGKKLQVFNAAQMAEKNARHQQLRKEQRDFEVMNAQFIAEEEREFQQYSQSVIGAAAEAQRNVFPLCKAAKEGMGGGLGPISCGLRSSYLVQDRTGAQIPNYVSGATQSIKKLNEAVDIDEAKKRLGFTWW